MDYIIAKFPFRVHTVRTENGHKFQAKFHWYLSDLWINYVYIRPCTPRLNRKVERSHGTDEREFYQPLTYKDDVDLNRKLTQWEEFYNVHRPHGSLNGHTPYEALRTRLKVWFNCLKRFEASHFSQSAPHNNFEKILKQSMGSIRKLTLIGWFSGLLHLQLLSFTPAALSSESIIFIVFDQPVFSVLMFLHAFLYLSLKIIRPRFSSSCPTW